MKEEQSQFLYVPGASTVGVVCNDGVVLASEKRVSYGSFVVSRAGKKVFKLTDCIGAACAGLVSDMQVLVRQLKAHFNLFNLETGRPITVKAAAKLTSNVLFSNRYFPLITQTVVGGIDDEGPAIFVLDVLGSAIPDKYTAVGSGAEISIGVLEDGYREDLTLQQGRDLVVKAIKSAISRDAMSGDGIDFLIISKDGIKEETIRV